MVVCSPLLVFTIIHGSRKEVSTDTVGPSHLGTRTGKYIVGPITFSPLTSLYRGRFTQAHLKCCPKLTKPGKETKEKYIRSEIKQNNNDNNKIIKE